MDFQTHLTIRQLRLLKVLGKELNLRRAAEVLNSSQPAVSRSLMEIEAALGARLFERSTRKVTVTPVGRNLIWHAERILGDLEQAQSDFQALSRGAAGGLDVGVLRGFSPAVLADAVTLMNTRMPRIDIRFREGFVEDHVDNLEHGRVDLVLSHLELPSLSKQIVVDPLYEDSIGLLTSRKHPLARRKRVEWREIADYPWVAPPVGTTVRLALERMPLNLSLKKERRPMIEVTAPHFAVAVIRRNHDAIAAMPMQLARWFDAELGAAQCLRMESSLLTWPLYSARLRTRQISDAARLFVDCLKTVAGAQAAARSATA
ncbi:MAG: LysR family transcriptional regulator [Pseudolabrys sp.]|nr:LysR family transcriptional regulator [Pseudolabrys sp.]MCW5683696.1 LysR family transcriptional regulator [Pseudolabrys sp.]